MKVRQQAILCLALMSALLAGCESTQQVRQSIQPTARMVGFKLQDAKLDFVTAIFEVEVDNPYSVSLPLISLSYSITSDANMFLSATAIARTTVPANSKEVFALQNKIVYERLLRALKGKAGSTIPYQAELRLWVDAPDAGLVKLPLEGAGRLAHS